VRYEKVLVTLAMLALLVTSVAHLGCTSDEANASTDGDAKSAAQTASDSGDGDSDQEGKSADADGKDGEDGEDGEDENKEQAIPVEVTELSRGDIEALLRFSANLEAESQVQVFSQARRLITERLVEEGDRVTKGQLLVRLQDDEQRSVIEKIKSQLAKEEREYDQQKRLFSQQLISEQQFNDATYELDQLNISLRDAERELGYTEVTAPIAGTITARMVSLGDQVQIGQHLFDIIDFDSMVARIFVPEKHLGLLRRGLTARLTAQASAARIYTGTVNRIAPIVDPKSGTVKVTVDVGSQQGLRPGMYVDVDLVTATHNEAVLVPKRAVVYDNDQMFIFRLGDERRVERIFIEPKLADKFFVEPFEGVTAGDQIVVAGQAGLKDGALVSLPGDKTGEDESADDAAATTDTERASL